jgi:hypothetical protein
MRVHKITTETGSVYLVYETSEAAVGNLKTVLYINQEGAVKNPDRYGGNEWDTEQSCGITPWPPKVGESMLVTRHQVPWGQGQVTLTSRVRKVETTIHERH